VTRSEAAFFCGFFASMLFRRFFHIVSKISSVMKKSITYLRNYSVVLNSQIWGNIYKKIVKAKGATKA